MAAPELFFGECLLLDHMAGPLPTEFVKLEEITKWYKNPVHLELHKWFDIFASLVRSKRICHGTKVLATVRDETVDRFKVLIDMTDWLDSDKLHEFVRGDIIFFKRAIVPASADIVVVAEISTFHLNPPSSASTMSSLEMLFFAYWSPTHVIVTNEAKCRERIKELRHFVRNKTNTLHEAIQDVSNYSNANMTESDPEIHDNSESSYE